MRHGRRVIGLALTATLVASAAGAETGMEISGRVRFDDGAPAANARVLATGAPEAAPDASAAARMAGAKVCEARTKADGSYTLVCAGVDWLQVQVLSPTEDAKMSRSKQNTLVLGGPGRRYTRAKSPRTGVDFQLPRGTTISGMVVDPDGHPLGGVQVGAIAPGALVPMPLYVGDAVSDGAGKFVTGSALSVDKFKVWAFAPGFPCCR